jgi:hypothetical protein
MMAYWNTGKMGLKEEKQFINDLFRFYYPTFHYSIIPAFQHSNALAGGYGN